METCGMAVEHRANTALDANDMLRINHVMDTYGDREVFMREQPWRRPLLLRDLGVVLGDTPKEKAASLARSDNSRCTEFFREQHNKLNEVGYIVLRGVLNDDGLYEGEQREDSIQPLLDFFESKFKGESSFQDPEQGKWWGPIHNQTVAQDIKDQTEGIARYATLRGAVLDELERPNNHELMKTRLRLDMRILLAAGKLQLVGDTQHTFRGNKTGGRFLLTSPRWGRQRPHLDYRAATE